MPKVYIRTYKGLFERHKAKLSAIKYPDFKIGDIVKVVPNILDIDARITASNDGYIGEQVRRRERYRYFLRNSTRGKIMDIRNGNIYVKMKVKDPFYRKKHRTSQLIIFFKQMIIPA